MIADRLSFFRARLSVEVLTDRLVVVREKRGNGAGTYVAAPRCDVAEVQS